MKKLYRKGTVHPSPPIISDQLSFLPATILTLTAALSPEDREVLAYLISCSSSSNNTFSGHPRRTTSAKSTATASDGDHAPLFSCSCFGCYMSYWVRWDSSPNRQLIHEIIDAFEEWLAQKGGKKNNNGGRKEKRNKRATNKQPAELTRNELAVSSEGCSTESTESESVVESSNKSGGGGEGGERVEEEEKGSVRRFVSFIGERIWGPWGQ